MAKTLQTFADSCREWYKTRTLHNHEARAKVYSVLLKRYSSDAVLRHLAAIKSVLDRVEEQAKEEARDEQTM
jgi:hypothetical protein